MTVLPADLSTDCPVAPAAEESPGYREAVDYLFGRIDFERLAHDRYSSADFKLQRMQALLAALGDPQLALPTVHIAGTKGKGSTAAMIAAMLTSAGVRTGLYTSPHLFRFEERMVVDGVVPSPARIVELVREVRAAAESLPATPPTFFELVTAMAWLHFRDEGCGAVVLEVGLGGRLDSTNVCQPNVSLITSISHDHLRLLGPTLVHVAREKAGIVKPGTPVLCGAAGADVREAIATICREKNAPLYELGEAIQLNRIEMDLTHPRLPPRYRIDVENPWMRHSDIVLPLAGAHQARNAALALAAVDLLRRQGMPIDVEASRRGLESLRWPLRVEVLQESPTTIVDAAHNDASIDALLETLQHVQASRRILIFGTSQDKDVPDLLRRLDGGFDEVILTRYQRNPRSCPIQELSAIAAEWMSHPTRAAAMPAEALALARQLAGPDDLICVAGSFFLASEVRELVAAGR